MELQEPHTPQPTSQKRDSGQSQEDSSSVSHRLNEHQQGSGDTEPLRRQCVSSSPFAEHLALAAVDLLLSVLNVSLLAKLRPPWFQEASEDVRGEETLPPLSVVYVVSSALVIGLLGVVFKAVVIVWCLKRTHFRVPRSGVPVTLLLLGYELPADCLGGYTICLRTFGFISASWVFLGALFFQLMGAPLEDIFSSLMLAVFFAALGGVNPYLTAVAEACRSSSWLCSSTSNMPSKRPPPDAAAANTTRAAGADTAAAPLTTPSSSSVAAASETASPPEAATKAPPAKAAAAAQATATAPLVLAVRPLRDSRYWEALPGWLRGLTVSVEILMRVLDFICFPLFNLCLLLYRFCLKRRGEEWWRRSELSPKAIANMLVYVSLLPLFLSCISALLGCILLPMDWPTVYVLYPSPLLLFVSLSYPFFCLFVFLLLLLLPLCCALPTPHAKAFPFLQEMVLSSFSHSLHGPPDAS